MVDLYQVENIALDVPSRVFGTRCEAFQLLSTIWPTTASSTRFDFRAESKFLVRVKVFLDLFKHKLGPLFKANNGDFS